MKQEQQAGEVIDFAGDGKFDSMGKAWNTFHQMQLQFNIGNYYFRIFSCLLYLCYPGAEG